MFVNKKTLLTAILILCTAFIGVLFNSSVVCRASVLLLLVICILRGMREEYLLNPYYMFALVPFTLLIYANISRYHADLTVNTWLIAIINIAAFIVAVDFTPAYRSTSKCVGVGEGKSLKKHAVLLLGLGFLPTVYSLLLGGTMPLASVFALFSTAALVCTMKSKTKSFIVGVLVIYIISFLGYVTKSAIMTVAFAFLISYEKYYTTTVKKKRRLFLFVILGMLLMIAAFSFANQGRGSEVGTSAIEYYTKYGDLHWNGNASLFMPYMYLTTPWTNLQYVMETQSSHTFGLWLIKPLLGYLQIDNLLGKYYELIPSSSFNTFTYISCCFKDFGFWGSCISSVFLGYFTKKVYSRFMISRSPLDVACYVLVAQAVAEMFFSNHFFSQSYPFTIVIIMGIYKVVFCRNNGVEIEEKIGEVL